MGFWLTRVKVTSQSAVQSVGHGAAAMLLSVTEPLDVVDVEFPSTPVTTMSPSSLPRTVQRRVGPVPEMNRSMARAKDSVLIFDWVVFFFDG